MTKFKHKFLYIILCVAFIITLDIFFIVLNTKSINSNKSVHSVDIIAENNEISSKCGGIILNGYILTVAHIFSKINTKTYDNIKITAYDSIDNRSYVLKPKFIDTEKDLAIFSTEKLPYINIRICEYVFYPQNAYIILNSETIKKVYVSRSVFDGFKKMHEMNIEIENGYSGYPIINKSGYLIGIICSYDNVNKKSYAITCEEIKRFLSVNSECMV